MAPLDQQLLSYDLIQVHRLRGITLNSHVREESAQVRNDDIEKVLARLNVLVATGKFKYARQSRWDVVLEKVCES